MCGLLHVKRFDGKNAVKMTERRYHHQKERGKEGFGFVGLNGGVVGKHLRASEEDTILEALKITTADEVLFHHRNPSSTINVWECAHPFLISIPSLTHDYYVAHNGVIYNTEELKKEHDKEGIRYTSLLREYWLSEEGNVRNGIQKWNDSESLAIELAKSLDAKEPTSIAEIRGTIAFIVIKIERKSRKAVKLYWGRNYGNPLNFFKNDAFLVLSSTGKGEEAKPHRLYSFDYETKKVEDIAYTVGVSYSQHTGYPHHISRDDDARDPMDRIFDSKPRAGFSQPAIPLIGSPSDEHMYDLEQWMDDCADLERIEASLFKAEDPTAIAFLLEQKADLEASIEAFDKKYPTVNAK